MGFQRLWLHGRPSSSAIHHSKSGFPALDTLCGRRSGLTFSFAVLLLSRRQFYQRDVMAESTHLRTRFAVPMVTLVVAFTASTLERAAPHAATGDVIVYETYGYYG